MQVLMVDKNPERLRTVRRFLLAKMVGLLEVPDAFAAMAALGRADFDALVVAEERRTMSMRGLLLLAKKRHPDAGIFVLLNQGTDMRAINTALGVNVDFITAEEDIEAVMTRVLASVVLASPDPFPVPTSQEVQMAVQDAQREALSVAPTPVLLMPAVKVAPAPVATAAPPPARVPTPVTVPVVGVHLEGSLEDDSGAALLLALFAQELTGRLTVEDGPGEGTIYFLRGEPVFVEDSAGDVGLWDKLIRQGVVKPLTRRPVAPPGQLLSSLTGLCTGEAMHNFLKTQVRDHVLGLVAQTTGTYAFDEDRSFVDHVPLLRVNPVGLIMEARRKSTPPDELLTLSRGLDTQYLHPGPGLAVASKKLEPFLRGGSAVALINGSTTVGTFCTESKLGPLMGTLMVQVLTETRLVSLHDGPYRPNASSITLRQALPRAPEEDEDTQVMHVPEAELEAANETDAGARNDIFALYTRLKTLKLPRQVLGVPAYADRQAIDRAYEAIMRDLDGKRIPEGSAKALLGTRVEEVKRKVQASYQALLLEMDEQKPNNPF